MAAGLSLSFYVETVFIFLLFLKKNEKIKLRRGKSKAFIFANLIRPNVFPCAEKLVEILVKNKHNNNVYLAGISCVGNNVELYNIDIEDGSDDIVISIKDFDENYIFT